MRRSNQDDPLLIADRPDNNITGKRHLERASTTRSSLHISQRPKFNLALSPDEIAIKTKTSHDDKNRPMPVFVFVFVFVFVRIIALASRLQAIQRIVRYGFQR